jgi:hypothetical protein
VTIFGAFMKSFQGTRIIALGVAGVAGSIIAIAALLNCGGSSNNGPGVMALSVAADGSCTPRLEKDLNRYLESCQDFSGDVDLHPEKLKKLVDACNLLTQAHDEGVVCNLVHLPNIDDRDVRSCLKLSEDQTAPNGYLVLRLKGLHEKCAKYITQYSDLLAQGTPPSYSEARDPHRPHISHRTDGDGD